MISSQDLDFESLKPLLKDKKPRKAKPFSNIKSKHLSVTHKPTRVVLQPPKIKPPSGEVKEMHTKLQTIRSDLNAGKISFELAITRMNKIHEDVKTKYLSPYKKPNEQPGT